MKEERKEAISAELMKFQAVRQEPSDRQKRRKKIPIEPGKAVTEEEAKELMKMAQAKKKLSLAGKCGRPTKKK